MIPEALLNILTFSPVDLEVTDPDGLSVGMGWNDIPGALHIVGDYDNDGDSEQVIIIPDRKTGEYTIKLTPQPESQPTDTYSLMVVGGNQTIILAQDVPVSSIPDGPYTLDTSETEISTAPVANANGPYSGSEGSAISFTGNGSYDVDGAIILYEWDFDDDGDFDSASTVPQVEHVYGDDFFGNVTLRVTDDEGLVGIDKVEVLVCNVAPTIDAVRAPQDPVGVGTTIIVQGNFTDPGSLDTHTALWDWRDGTTSDGVVEEENGSGNVTGSHAYTEPGVYTIALTVVDDDGGNDTAEYRYIVVYDPEGGFVTGGGWIESPEGAYTADPTLTGKANFGFVSKYKRGATTPTGETEFQFKVADLDFHSDSYQWLVIAGHQAKYKGVGTINGTGDYGFMLTAIDEKLTPSASNDLFRIKIWDKDNNDAVIYDNMMEAADDADPATEIGGGSIVIHK